MTMTETMVLSTMTGPYGHTQALRDGTVSSPRLKLDAKEYDPVHDMFPDMVRRQHYDVCELAVNTYLAGRHHNKGVIGFPIVLVRGFHYGSMTCNARSVQSPKDLEGKKVGMRSWGQTTAISARGILQNEYGVDLGKVTWIMVEDEHVPELQPPAGINATRQKGGNLEQMLNAGEVDAIIGAAKGPDARPLIADAEKVAADWFKRTGIYTVNHMLVMKRSLYEQHPWLAREIYDAFVQAKEINQQRVAQSGPTTAEDKRYAGLAAIVGGDPLPYGVRANWPGFDLMQHYAVQQGVLPRKFTPEELFPAELLNT